MVSGEVLLILYSTIFVTNVMVLPQLLLKKVCIQNGIISANVTLSCQDQSNEALQKEASVWWLGLILSNLLPGLFIIMIWGPVTDQVGRKYSTIYVSLVNVLQNILYIINSYYVALHPGYLLFGSIISSFYGEFQGVISLSYACVSDSTATTLTSRTMRMMIAEAMLAFSGVLAGIISGTILHHFGFVYVFVFNVCLDILIFLFAIFYIPSKSNVKNIANNEEESHLLRLTQEIDGSDSGANHSDSNTDLPLSNLIEGAESATENTKEKKTSTHYNLFHHFNSSLKIITDKEHRHFIIPLFIALGLALSGILGEASIQILYVKNEPFEFSAALIGYYVAMQSLLRGFSAIVISQLSYRWLHLSDYTLMIVGLISETISFILVGLSRSTVAIFLSQIPGCFMFITLPAIRSHITKELINQADAGTVLASLEAADILFNLISSSLALWVYHITMDIYTGLSYFVLSIVCVFALVCTSFAKYQQNKILSP